MGETERVPAVSEGACAGEPIEGIDRMEGAEGGEVNAGTEARYFAP